MVVVVVMKFLFVLLWGMCVCVSVNTFVSMSPAHIDEFFEDLMLKLP